MVTHRALHKFFKFFFRTYIKINKIEKFVNTPIERKIRHSNNIVRQHIELELYYKSISFKS